MKKSPRHRYRTEILCRVQVYPKDAIQVKSGDRKLTVQVYNSTEDTIHMIATRRVRISYNGKKEKTKC